MIFKGTLFLLLLLAMQTVQAARNLAVTVRPGVENRVALVIGNKDYADAPLTNPLNDARDMQATLQRLGFTVIYRENASFEAMDDAMHEFARRLNKDSVALFYFSGHGVQADGVNYLIPVGARIASKSEVKSRAYDANIALGTMEEAGARVNVVVLDACRNAAFRGYRSPQGGLAQMGGGSGSIIAFATAPGDTAEDGTGRNGTFTKHLLAHLDEPGLTAIEALQKVQTEVADETRDDQKPWINFGPQRGEFCFAGCEESGVKPPVVTPPPKVDPVAAEQEFWDNVKASTDPADFEAYLDQYPSGRHAPLARNAIKRLRQRVADAEEKPVRPQPSPTPVSSPTCIDCPEMVRLPSLGISMGKYEVTQGQWRRIMGDNPSKFSSCGDDCPVEQVSWDDVQAFIEKLNAKTGQRFRLPTEDEWYAACQAGGRYEYCGSDNIEALAWYGGNSGDKTHPVGRKQANAWGLYDMSGNVWEWTEDCWEGDCGRRAVRGGAWNGLSADIRSAFRIRLLPSLRYSYTGFRLAQD